MTKRNEKVKVMAVVMVLVMLMVSIVPFSEGFDASSGDGETYTYTLTYDSSAMSSGSAAISVSTMDAINHPSYSGGTTSGYGDWTWNSTTGLGPFNSFYAAFDMTDGNSFYAVLNPYDLTKTIDGVSLATIGDYNIMWVLPTVYWSSTSTTLTLTNDNTTGGTAYAHTINGHTYKYIAIGVYEGSTTDVGGKTVLTSASGTTPVASQNISTFRTYAHNYTMSESLKGDSSYNAYSMQWNFYQWQLYKYCCWTLMEDFNSQSVVGNGPVYSGNSGSTNQYGHTSSYAWTTGYTNALGPYTGDPTSITDNTSFANYGEQPVKLFIENAWGGVREFVDGININAKAGAYIDTSDTPSHGTSGTYVSAVTWTIADGYPTSIQTANAQVWGFSGSTTTTASSGYIVGLSDYTYTSSSTDSVLTVGGNAHPDWSAAVRYGLSFANASSATSFSHDFLGSRLAFVFDADPASSSTIDLDFDISESGYGTISNGSESGETLSLPGLTSGVTVSVSGTVLTISDGSSTLGQITASPTTSTNQYTYTFDGFYLNGSKITSDETLTESATITATFTRTLTTHSATIESNNIEYGTVSTVGSFTGIPYGETFTVDGTTLSIYNFTAVALVNNATVRYEYSFDSFQSSGTVITTGLAMTDDMTIRAVFSSTELVYTVIIQSNNTDYGTVTNAGSYSGIPGGSTFTVDGTSLALNPTDGTTQQFVATVADTDAQYTYAFDGWYDALTGGNAITSSSTVTSNMNVYARFTATIRNYTVSVESSDTSCGTVSNDSVENVPYGTVITLSTNTNTNDTLNVNGTTILASPLASTSAKTYTFDGWQINGTDVTTSYTVTGAVTFTATFSDGTQKYYVYFLANDSSYGNVTPNYLYVPYGSTFTVNGSALTLNGATITASVADTDAQYTYAFDGWYDALTGGNAITDSSSVSGTMNVYARFTATTRNYTVSVESNNTEYGTVSPSSISNVPYGSIITTTSASLTVDGRVIAATPATSSDEYVYSLARWMLDGEDIVSGTTTITGNNTVTAIFIQGTEAFVLRYDIGSGTGTFPDQTAAQEDQETTYTFTISSDEPTYYGRYFAGWTTTEGSDDVEYEPGDSITVTIGEITTLYAVYEDSESVTIVKAVPYMVIVGIILGVVGTLHVGRGNGMSMKTMVDVSIGGAVSVLVVVFVLIPMIG